MLLIAKATSALKMLQEASLDLISWVTDLSLKQIQQFQAESQQ